MITAAIDWETHFRTPVSNAGRWLDLPAWLSNPQIIILALIIAFLAVSAARQYAHRRKRRNTSRYRRPWLAYDASVAKTSAPPNMADPHAQLDAVGRVGFERIRLLNREEAPLLPLLEQVVRDLGLGHRVMAQTSLGEVLKPKTGSGTKTELSAAYASINSKRLDFAVIDRGGFLLCAVEYQGTGHHQHQAFVRDAVKREALRRAGVPLLEIAPKFDPAEVQATMRRLLAPGSQHSHTAVHV